MNEFDEVYNKYFKDVYCFILNLSKDSHIAEDITQETFFKAMKSIKSFEGRCSIKSWLIQIAKNTYFDYLKKENKYDLNTNIESNIDKSIESLILDKESSFYVHTIIHNLDEPYKEVFTLRVFAELSFLQISKLFNKTESWARVTFHRAKKKIQIIIKEESHE
ncbi:MAG: RNA polymerase sigma factor [Peptostreptococcaceae bacterium]